MEIQRCEDITGRTMSSKATSRTFISWRPSMVPISRARVVVVVMVTDYRRTEATL